MNGPQTCPNTLPLDTGEDCQPPPRPPLWENPVLLERCVWICLNRRMVINLKTLQLCRSSACPSPRPRRPVAAGVDPCASGRVDPRASESTKGRLGGVKTDCHFHQPATGPALGKQEKARPASLAPVSGDAAEGSIRFGHQVRRKNQSFLSDSKVS